MNDLRRSRVQTQTARTTGDNGDLALQGEKRREIFQLSFSHCFVFVFVVVKREMDR